MSSNSSRHDGVLARSDLLFLGVSGGDLCVDDFSSDDDREITEGVVVGSIASSVKAVYVIGLSDFVCDFLLGVEDVEDFDFLLGVESLDLLRFVAMWRIL